MSSNTKQRAIDGLSLTHNCLKVQDAKSLANFYTTKLGMSLISHRDYEKEEVCIVGYEDKSTNEWHPVKTFLELRSSKETCAPNFVNPYRSAQSDIYWKIGIGVDSVNDFADSLREKSDVNVGRGSQFVDVGFLTHLRDDEGFCVELLQNNFLHLVPNSGVTLSPSTHDTPPHIGQITLRVNDIDASLHFYKDVLGMQLLCREDVSMYGFNLYFLAWTEEKPPNDDVNALENREWVYQRPYCTLELQHSPCMRVGLYQPLGSHDCGFAGLKCYSPKVLQLKEHLKKKVLFEENNDDNGLPCLTLHDPDGTPIFINQIPLT